jgi:hypothetical protein
MVTSARTQRKTARTPPETVKVEAGARGANHSLRSGRGAYQHRSETTRTELIYLEDHGNLKSAGQETGDLPEAASL